MTDFFLPPIITFNEYVTIDDLSKNELINVISHCFCLNDLCQIKIKEIQVINSKVFFAISKHYNKLMIEIPHDLCYNVDTKLWSSTCKYIFFNINVETHEIHLTSDQLIVIFCHEINHYKNGDIELTNSIFMQIYNLTSNPICFMLMCYLCTSSIYPLLLTIFWNQCYAKRNRFIEKRADINTFPLKQMMKNDALSLWIKLKDNKLIKSSCPKIIKFILYLYVNIYCGYTHPSYDERIKYCS